MKYTVSIQFKRETEGFLVWLEDYPHITVRKADLKEATQYLSNRLLVELEGQLAALKAGNVKVTTQDLTEMFKELEKQNAGKEKKTRKNESAKSEANTATVEGRD